MQVTDGEESERQMLASNCEHLWKNGFLVARGHNLSSCLLAADAFLW